MPWHCDCQPPSCRRQAEGALIPSAMPCPLVRTTAAKSPPKALFRGALKGAGKAGAPDHPPPAALLRPMGILPQAAAMGALSPCFCCTRSQSRVGCQRRNHRPHRRFSVQQKKDILADVLSSWRRHPDLNRGMRVLQTLALPLGYVAIIYLQCHSMRHHRHTAQEKILSHGIFNYSM